MSAVIDACTVHHGREFQKISFLRAKYVRAHLASQRVVPTEISKSVRVLERTTTTIYHAAGRHDPKPHFAIVAGLLCLESKWSPTFGKPFKSAIASLGPKQQLQIGCCLHAGTFECDWAAPIPAISASPKDTALIYFFLRLLAQLQKLGTVPAIDLDAYAKQLLLK